MTDSERIEYLYGKIDALQGTIGALIATHQNLPGLLPAMETIWETRVAGHLNSPTTDVFSEGFAEPTTQFRGLAKSLLDPEKP